MTYNNNNTKIDNVSSVVATTGMIVWEAMLDLMNAPPETGQIEAHKGINEAQQGYGSFEMRDVALHIALFCEEVMLILNQGDFNDGILAFDFEIVPWIVQQLDWSKASPVPPLEDASGTARRLIEAHPVEYQGRIHPLFHFDQSKSETEPFVPPVIERVEQAIASDDDIVERNNERLAVLYEEAGTVERATLDAAFTHLCGWSLKTLLKKEDPFR